MMTIDMIVAMLAWPALAAALVVAVAWVPPVARSPMRNLIGPLAIFAGFTVGYWVVVGQPDPTPPLDAKSRLPHVAAVAVIVAAVTASSERRGLAVTGYLLGSAVAMWLVLAAAIEFRWGMAETVVRMALLSVTMAGLMLAGSSLTRRLSPRPGGLVLAGLAGLSAPLMLFSDTLLVAQLHGTLGIAATVVAAAVWLSPAKISAAPAIVVVVAVAWSQWVIALLFANMPVVSFVLLVAAAPLALVAGSSLERWRRRGYALAALGVMAACLAGAAAVGGVRYVRTSSPGPAAGSTSAPTGDYGYGYE